MADEQEETNVKKPVEGRVTLTQMLKALDKDVATGIEKRLKKLSKKKAVTAPMDEHKVAQLERKEAYEEVTKDISKWDPIVERNRRAKQLRFPLDQEPDHLPSTADSLDIINPRNDLEKEVQAIIDENKNALLEHKESTRREEEYQKAISIEEAKDRHKELQKMRVKLSTYAAKMRRQKGIKSKSYRRLLKRERLKNHMKKVESNKDALLDEIERLQRLRAQERASLKHKNTGKWAKHAKFRAKYDEEARNAMLEQIGIAGKLLERPALPDSDSEESEEEEDQDENDDEISDVSEHESSGEDEVAAEQTVEEKPGIVSDRLIVSTELVSDHSKKKRRSSLGENDLDSSVDGGDAEGDSDEDEQRKLMSEAFANDDVVGEFKKIKDQMADEEQPKDIDTFLPGWGNWAGPGIKVSKRKREKYIIRAKKIKRKDETLGNVIISEKANDVIRDLQLKKLPRGVMNDKHLRNILTKPTTGTFTDQTTHREAVRPRIDTRMGQRIEPIDQRVLQGMGKAEWL